MTTSWLVYALERNGVQDYDVPAWEALDKMIPITHRKRNKLLGVHPEPVEA